MKLTPAVAWAVLAIGMWMAWLTRPPASGSRRLGNEPLGRGSRRAFALAPLPAATCRAVAIVIGAVVVAAGLWPFAVAFGGALAVLPRLWNHLVRRRRAARVARELPDIFDLVMLAAGSGYTVAETIAAVSRAGRGLVADRLARVYSEFASGRPLDEAIEALSDLDPALSGLADALIVSLWHGVALTEALQAPAVELRASRRRAGEVAARRVPVRLLFPLVFCILPAFGLLTVVPVLWASLEAVRQGS
ncbi:MAG: type II secretion system F family protein [Acidimicrobiales bacterium]|nr:type II secretion system F family protein [Acidimicrobiales bacterium]